jgi:hypothetical protein
LFAEPLLSNSYCIVAYLVVIAKQQVCLPQYENCVVQGLEPMGNMEICLCNVCTQKIKVQNKQVYYGQMYYKKLLLFAPMLHMYKNIRN